MPRKFDGPWDDYPLLHRLMDEGRVYVECLNCGAHIQSWVTIMSGRCHNCGQSHGIHERKASVEKRRDAERRLRLDRAYAFLKATFLQGRACSYRLEARYPDVELSQVVMLRGESAWTHLIDLIFRNSRYTAFRCPGCTFLHIADVGGDINVATGLFHIMPTGRRDARNWTASFICASCRRSSSLPVSVSLDPNVAGKRVGNPLRIGPLRWWWLSLFRAVPHEE